MLTAAVVALWWLGFWTAIGLCVGSFLNVVVFRLPRNRSLRTPLWSACPYCEHPIRFWDNLPIVSFILLRGRCRDCRAPIPTRYLVIEATMALVVLMLIDAFLIGHVRSGLSARGFGLTEDLAYDWPILAAHVVLLACLLSMSVIDLEHYWVDVRFTNVATIVGFVLHTLWTPQHSMSWGRPFDTTAVMSLCALVGMGLVWLVSVCQPHMDAEDFGEAALSEEPSEMPDRSEDEPPWPPLEVPSRIPGWISVAMLVVLFAWLIAAEVGGERSAHVVRALVPLAFLFSLIIRESSIHRESDHEIVEAIEGERMGSRRMVLCELGWLLPAVGLACLGFYLMRRGGDLPDQVHAALHAHTRVWSVPMMRSWVPVYGFATAASGYVVAGALGWMVRIVFTLVFGREAFGTGDIHLMAAAGCIAGWPVVALAFILTCGLASAGWLVLLPFKRTRAVPLGPWLSLSILTVVIFYDSLVKWPVIARTIDASRMLFLDNSQVWDVG